jgi:hypothetical protein
MPPGPRRDLSFYYRPRAGALAQDVLTQLRVLCRKRSRSPCRFRRRCLPLRPTWSANSLRWWRHGLSITLTKSASVEVSSASSAPTRTYAGKSDLSALRALVWARLSMWPRHRTLRRKLTSVFRTEVGEENLRNSQLPCALLIAAWSGGRSQGGYYTPTIPGLRRRCSVVRRDLESRTQLEIAN